jgi:HEAT repeats
MNSSEIQAFFARTLLGHYDDEEGWAAVQALRREGSREVFEFAASWCASGDALERARAADVLCQLQGTGTRERPFRHESYLLITRMLESEQDCNVLRSAITGLGHLDDANAVPLILRYQDHPDHNIRFAVAFALGCFPSDERPVRGLLQLTADADSEVRDWAVFGLAYAAADSPEIRNALFRCLDDVNEDVREEAAVGLGKRRDKRVIPKLLAWLEEPGLKVRVAEAAAALLGLDPEPDAWKSADYRAAILSTFRLEG